MIIGVTGSRSGMTEYQTNQLNKELRLDGLEKAHHGDCVGVDRQFNDLLENLYDNIFIIVHPPVKVTWRAFCRPRLGEVLKPKEYLLRNDDIVNAVDLLFVIPKDTEILPKGTRGSGTWYTYHYAQNQGVKTLIIWPDGSVT